MKRRYHYGSAPLADSEVSGASRFTTWLSLDAQGSVTDSTQADGTVRSGRKYDAWGQYRNVTAPRPDEPKLGYTGHQFDPETTLIYARARYYDSEVGTLLSRDPREAPLGETPWLHRYVYVRSNPIRYVDIDGLDVGAARVLTSEEMTAQDAWIRGNVETDGSIYTGLGSYPPPQPTVAADALQDEFKPVPVYMQPVRGGICGVELGPCGELAAGYRNTFVVTEDNQEAVKAYSIVRNAALRPRNSDADLVEGYNAVYGILSHPNGPPPPSGLLAPKVWGADYTKIGLSEEEGSAVEQFVQIHDTEVRQRYWTGVAAGAVSLTSDFAGAVTLAAPGAAAATTSREGFDMALGLARHGETGSPTLLRNFASRVGAKTYGDIYGSWWPGSMEALETNIRKVITGAERLHFNLDQMNMAVFQDFARNPAFRSGNITNWELNTVLRDPNLLQKTNFYGPGGILIAPPMLP
jgi:RHS repeat-associated protein